jgi:NAD(P)-dependent dehydrogenase (short-subunit alcohol dehydrogenase family)
VSVGAACVVGAKGGIGSAVVDRLSRDGWQPVIGMDLVGPIALDVTDERSIEAAFARAKEQTAKLDLLVVAAGIVDQAPAATLSRERWERVLAVNLTGAFLCCKAALDWLGEGGRIVLIGSLSGRTGGGVTGVAYAVSKGGIETLAKGLARELAPRNITVNCIAPGAVDTTMFASNDPHAQAGMIAATPLKRMGRPEEIAGVVAFLASDDAGFITGATIGVNGGLRMD